VGGAKIKAYRAWMARPGWYDGILIVLIALLRVHSALILQI